MELYIYLIYFTTIFYIDNHEKSLNLIFSSTKMQDPNYKSFKHPQGEINYSIFIFLGSNEKETTEKTEEPPKEDIKPMHEESEYPEPSKDTEEKAKKKNETKSSEDKSGNKTEKADKEKKATIVQIKEPINSNEIRLGSQILSDEKLAQSQDK